MNINTEDKEIYKIVKKQFDSIFDVFDSETFIASIYLLEYFETGDNKYYNMFLEKMDNFTLEEKKMVLSNVISNLKERHKNNKHKEKVKKHE